MVPIDACLIITLHNDAMTSHDESQLLVSSYSCLLPPATLSYFFSLEGFPAHFLAIPTLSSQTHVRFLNTATLPLTPQIFSSETVSLEELDAFFPVLDVLTGPDYLAAKDQLSPESQQQLALQTAVRRLLVQTSRASTTRSARCKPKDCRMLRTLRGQCAKNAGR